MNHIKYSGLLLLLLLVLAAVPVAAQGPDYHLDRYTVAGGSGPLSGGDYSLGGTAGQAEANPIALGNADYSLQAGFWAAFRRAGPVTLYLPVISKAYSTAPDLIITNLVATTNSINLTLRNQGNGPLTDAFWVDVYFDPAETPTLNQPWHTIAPAGATWGVTAIIPAGGTLDLTTGGDYYYPQYSSGSFPADVNVYGYVDSINFATRYGNVWESNEGNNVFGPALSAGGGEATTIEPGGPPPVRGDLPVRAE